MGVGVRNLFMVLPQMGDLSAVETPSQPDRKLRPYRTSLNNVFPKGI